MHEHLPRYRWPLRGFAAILLAAGLVVPAGCGASESRPPAQEEFQRRHQADLMEELDRIAAEEAERAEDGEETPPKPDSTPEAGSEPEPSPTPQPGEPVSPGGV